MSVRQSEPAAKAASLHPDAGAPSGAPAKSGGDSPLLPLALAIHRGGLGYELSGPHRLGPATLTALDVSLPGLKFPLDVTGGLSRFRHRRGVLEHLAFEIRYAELETYLGAALRGLLSPERPEVRITRISPDRLSVAVTAREQLATTWLRMQSAPSARLATPVARVLALEVVLDSAGTRDTDEGEDLRVLVGQARGAGLDVPATLLALRVLDALAAAAGGSREGSALRVPSPARALVRAFLPTAGLRVPDTAPFAWSARTFGEDALVCVGQRGPAAEREPAKELVTWRETWRILRAADDALVAGDAGRARELVLGALERAPKHPEALRRLAEIDGTRASARAEAALATLRERPLGPLGTLPADLAAAAGDGAGQIGALLHEAAHEPVPALAAELYLRAAELGPGADEVLSWLDLALAHAPAHVPARAARFYRRLCAGRNDEARADVEHLEAQTREGPERHDLLLAIGQLYAAAHKHADAARFFERALRQVPDDARALFGLGEALVEVGRIARGAALVARAIDLADPLSDPHVAPSDPRGVRKRTRKRARTVTLGVEELSHMRVRLAVHLAEGLGDEPAALARLALVPERGAWGAAARALEARYRARLGERAAASLAYARLREISRELVADAGAAPSAAAIAAADALEEAARFEEAERGDLENAARHLAAAVALVPRATARRAAYEAVLARAAAPRTPAPPPRALPEHATPHVPTVGPTHAAAPTPIPPPPAAASPAAIPTPMPPTAARQAMPSLGLLDDDADENVDDEILAEDLRHKFLQNPHDIGVQSGLVAVLERTGRGLELLALVVGMLEDAPSEAEREALMPVRNRVLEGLELAARARGSDGEADLYKMSREV